MRVLPADLRRLAHVAGATGPTSFRMAVSASPCVALSTRRFRFLALGKNPAESAQFIYEQFLIER